MKGIFFRVNAGRDLQSMANFMCALRFTKAFFAWVTKGRAIKLLSKVRTKTILRLEVKQLNEGYKASMTAPVGLRFPSEWREKSAGNLHRSVKGGLSEIFFF